jgi:hypothetical protein
MARLFRTLKFAARLSKHGVVSEKQIPIGGLSAKQETKMAYMTGEVLVPKKQGIPFMAVLMFEGEVLAARPFKTLAEGEAFIAKIMPELQAKIDQGRGS